MKTTTCCGLALLLATGCTGLIDSSGNTGVKKIGPAGGDVKTQGAALHVPAGALSQTVQITIKPVTEGNPDGLVGAAFEISDGDVAFDAPVELTLNFDKSALEAPDAAELVRVAVLQNGEWVELDSVADVSAGVVRASTTHFSRYGVVQICGNFRTCPANQICSRHRCRPIELCDDGVDNDGDGLVDCSDADCSTSPLCQARCCFDTIANQCVSSCCTNGVCLGNCYCGSGWCSRCATGGTETNCGDGVDNDNDGFVDCRDPDCSTDPACVTPREICNNGIDDNHNGLVDCADPDCASDPVACPSCCFVTITNQCVSSCCQNGVCQGNCFCGPQVCSQCGTTAREICDNGIDDDHDGLIDCLDPDCATSLSCRPQPTELNCSDGIDNDRDGLVDCQDPDCQGGPSCTCTGSPGCCYPRCSASETLVCLGANICGYPCHCEAAVDAGTPAPSLYSTCGDPVCGGWRAKPGIPLCASSQRAGDPCSTVGSECDPHDSCNTLLQCATSDPRMGTGCPISRERFKEAIDYLKPAELQQYHDELVSLPLATYRYKTQDDQRRHLGFIIDGHESMIAVQPERDQVDVYGYTSMAVAAIKVQAAQIAKLEQELGALKTECVRKPHK